MSDNGKAIKGTELKSFVASKNMKWRFIVEKSDFPIIFMERAKEENI